jgi:hypothetical protein
VFVAPPGVAGSRPEGCVYDAYTLWLRLHPGQDPAPGFVTRFENWPVLHDESIANDGIVPFDNIDRAYQALRDGHADRMYLLRGHDYVGPLSDCAGSFNKSGLDEFNPMIIGAYGSLSWERPRIIRPSVNLVQYPRAGCANGWDRELLRIQRQEGQSNLVFESLDFAALYRMPDEVPIPEDVKLHTPAAVTIFAQQDTRNILFQDVRIRGFGGGMTIESGSFCDHPTDITLHRCVVKDNYPGRGSRSSGIFTSNTYGLTVNECVFDHNGWSDRFDMIEYDFVGATIFNQNAYINETCTATTFTNNITSRAAHAGLQLRGGYDNIVANNLSVDNPLGLTIGSRNNNYPCRLPILCGSPPLGPVGSDEEPLVDCGVFVPQVLACGHSFLMEDNVVVGSDNVSKSAPRGQGINITRMHSGTVSNNIVAHGDTPLARRVSTTDRDDINGGLDRVGIVLDWTCRSNATASPKCTLPDCATDGQGIMFLSDNIVFEWNSAFRDGHTGFSLQLGGARSTQDPRDRGILQLPSGVRLVRNSFFEPCGASIVHYFGLQPFSEIDGLNFNGNQIFNWSTPDIIATRTISDGGQGRLVNEDVNIAEMSSNLTAVNVRYDQDSFPDPMRNIEITPRRGGACWYSPTVNSSYMAVIRRREPARYPGMPVSGANARHEFLERAADNRRGYWDENFTAARFNQFMRQGFGRN